MAGGLMQLVAYGSQDVYLTGNPKITFFQAVYRRHTNFAMECIEQVVNGSASNDGRLSVTIGRNGDLVGNMHMELAPENLARSTDNGSNADACWAAERAIKDIELSIGGSRIDKNYQKWWRLYSELYLDEAKKIQYGKMTSSNDPDPTASGNDSKVYLPLIFFFNRNPGLALPLIALQYHEVRLDFDLSSTYQTYFSTRVPKVWANYYFLDTEERRRMSQKGHEYLIEQVQHTGVDTVTEGQQTIRLSYNHPVKSLNWCYTGASGNNRLWNFCQNVDTVTMACDFSEGAVALAASSDCSAAATALCAQVSGSSAGCPQLVISGNATAAEFGSWAEEGANASINAVGPLDAFKVILNGQDRFKEQFGKYFNQVQPSVHNSGNPYPGIYTYSFALKPEDHQPTGTCNFSRIDNAQVSTTIKTGASNITQQHMFAVNYNVLRVQSGMGGLAFAN